MEERRGPSANGLSTEEEYLYHLAGDDPAETARFLGRHPAHSRELDDLRQRYDSLAPRIIEWARGRSTPWAVAALEGGSLQIDPLAPAIPGYRLIRVLGKGGMGVVYHAEKVSPHREVALKVIPTGGDPKVQERARREIQAMASLQSPNIVTLYESDALHGLFYYSMELLQGETLEELLAKWSRSHHPGRFHRAAEVLLDACAAVELPIHRSADRD